MFYYLIEYFLMLRGDQASPRTGAEYSLAKRSHIQFRSTHPTRWGPALCYWPGGGQGGEAGPNTVVDPDRSPFLQRYWELEAPYPLPVIWIIRDDPEDDGKNLRTHVDLCRIKGGWVGILNFVNWVAGSPAFSPLHLHPRSTECYVFRLQTHLFVAKSQAPNDVIKIS